MVCVYSRQRLLCALQTPPPSGNATRPVHNFAAFHLSIMLLFASGTMKRLVLVHKPAPRRCSPWAQRHKSSAPMQIRRAAPECPELPPELQGLTINEDGLLVDEKTGKVINEWGATRFDVAVRALRGEFDPKDPGVANTERTPGLLLDALMHFPGVYTFNVVMRLQGGAAPEQALADAAAVVARVCQVKVPLEQCNAKPRMGGKFASLSIPALVRAPEMIQRVMEELGKDERVVMKY